MTDQKFPLTVNQEHSQLQLPAAKAWHPHDTLLSGPTRPRAERHLFESALLFVWCILATTACASSAKIRSDPSFTSTELSDRTVLILPIAVSDEFEDKRTGMALNERVRYDAAAAACQYASKIRSDVKVLCFDDLSPGLRELTRRDVMNQFALDAPISTNVWQTLKQQSGASHVLLFRPESTTVVQATSAGPVVQPSDALTLGLGVWLVASAVGGSNPSQRTTKQSYFLSSALVDLQNGRVLRVGAHSREGSKSVPAARNLGYSEGPEAGPILQKVMQDLEVALLK